VRLNPPLTTGEVAAQMNAILESRVYDGRAIRAEIDSGRLRAVIGTRPTRRRLRVTEAEFLRWAALVLHDDELRRLRRQLTAAES